MIFHITSSLEWSAAGESGSYSPPSLSTDGFIHLSTREQTLSTAARYYGSASDLLLLAVDDSRLGVELRWEPPSDGSRPSERFPHLYRPLTMNEVTDARPFERDADLSFIFPY